MRGGAALTANVKGSGVGLAMVSHIVAAHGGAITVASQLGRGSTFTMLFPWRSDQTKIGPARILVVEDEPGIALGLEDDLKMEGYEVEVVADGSAAC